ncbi:unnamed protein product, partial [Arabidopsis halleri]
FHRHFHFTFTLSRKHHSLSFSRFSLPPLQPSKSSNTQNHHLLSFRFLTKASSLLLSSPSLITHELLSHFHLLLSLLCLFRFWNHKFFTTTSFHHRHRTFQASNRRTRFHQEPPWYSTTFSFPPHLFEIAKKLEITRPLQSIIDS